MASSMTGFGQAESGGQSPARYRVETKSVNHRYLDVAVRMPRDIQLLEERVRRTVQNYAARGRVDVYINRQEGQDEMATVVFDRTLAAAYLEALDEMCRFCALSEKPGLEILARFPDVIRVEKKETDLEQAWAEISPILESALQELARQRQAEGERLAEDIGSRLNALEELTAAVKERSPEVVADYRRRLEEKLRSFLDVTDTDKARVLTEVAVFADRSSIDEELVRLGSHLAACRETLRARGQVGRKLDFIAQELFREVNTIGSKANDYTIASLVVEMKAELEKIREQVQNIE
jgi:uncharacterized protein (TIGR00255 family)